MARTKALHLERFPVALPGEDRTYGGNDFHVDLVPRSAWFANLRAMMPLSHWRGLSAYVIARAHGACEICSSEERLEAHERWHFDPANGIQKLMRLMCVCKLCHLSIHSGIADVLGIREEIGFHIFQLTLWGKREMKQHMKEAGKRWEDLSVIAWEQDVSIAADAGIDLYSKAETWRRVQAKQSQLATKGSSTQLIIDGVRWDFARELAEGCVVFVAKSDEDMLGAVPAGDGSGVNYWVKDPRLLSPATARLDLKIFLRAHRHPQGISSDTEVKDALKADDGPKRLVLTNEVQLTDEMAVDALRRGIVFSRG